jgi:hypothetical protein
MISALHLLMYNGRSDKSVYLTCLPIEERVASRTGSLFIMKQTKSPIESTSLSHTRLNFHQCKAYACIANYQALRRPRKPPYFLRSSSF